MAHFRGFVMISSAQLKSFDVLPRIAFKNTVAIGRMTKRTRAGRHLSDPAAGGRLGLPEEDIALVNSMPDGVNFVDQHSTADSQIKLCRSLFRGRVDVYRLPSAIR